MGNRGLLLLFSSLYLQLVKGTGPPKTWYVGCSSSEDVRDIARLKSRAETVDKCASSCDQVGLLYTVVRGSGSNLDCRCLSIKPTNTSDHGDTANCCRSINGLHVGKGKNCWAVYRSKGPYLTSVTMETDMDFVIVNRSIAIEITVTRAAILNVTQDDPDFGHNLQLHWTVSGDDFSYHDNMNMGPYTDVFFRPKYTFTEVGNYSVDAEVSNGVTTLHASLDLQVTYPTPVDLQLGLPDNGQGQNIPSCIPDFNGAWSGQHISKNDEEEISAISLLPSDINQESKVKDNAMSNEEGQSVKDTDKGQVFAVFVNTSVEIEASVAIGENLTFTFHFDGDAEIKVIEACWSCLNASHERTFTNTGVHTVALTVQNQYGKLYRNITLVVVEPTLSDLHIDLDNRSSFLATTGQPVQFVASMVTTSREHRFLRVWYGDGKSDIVSLEDTDSPRLILTGTEKEMDIVASYGNGCTLTVEFEYIYQTEGLYRPIVKVYEEFPESSDESLNSDPGDRSLNVFDFDENLNNDNNNAQYLDLDIFGLPTESSTTISLMDFSGNVEENREDSGFVASGITSIEAVLSREIHAVAALQALRIYSPRIGACNEEIVIQLQVSSKLNVSFYWSVYRVIDDDGNLEDALSLHDIDGNYGENYFGDIDANSVILDFQSPDDLMHIENISSNSTEFKYKFSEAGVYFVSVLAENAISQAKSSSNLIVQCPVEGLAAWCRDYVIKSGSEFACFASVRGGSEVVFKWYIGRELVHVDYDNDSSSMFRYSKLTIPWDYHIGVIAQNNISETSYLISLPVTVQEPVKNVKVFIESKYILLGNATKLYLIYPYPNKEVDSYALDQLTFDFDFGDGRYSVMHECYEEYCYAASTHLFSNVGSHTVSMYVYNDVSEQKKTVEIFVYNHLDNVSVEIANEPIAGRQIVFRVMENGNTMETRDVYFTWNIGEQAAISVQSTNSPLIGKVLKEAGNFTLVLTVRNPAINKTLEIPLNVRSKSEGDLYIEHDLHVTPEKNVTFDLHLGDPDLEIEENGTISVDVHVRYEDGEAEQYSRVGNSLRWNHIFHKTGAQEISISVQHEPGAILTVMSSYVMVQEPISGLELHGPEALVYSVFEKQTWYATLASGTHVMYLWTFENTSLIAPTSQFEHDIPKPGIYRLTVEAFNDVTPVPQSASLTVYVDLDILPVDMDILGGLVGSETEIHINTSYGSFYIAVDYGDGSSEIWFSRDPNLRVASLTERLQSIKLMHIYKDIGDYNITVNVSNSVNSYANWEVFSPISDVTLKSRSPWIMSSSGHAVVMATVTGGKDLSYLWSFSDTYEQTLVKRLPKEENNTCIEKHSFSIAGKYEVSLNVTGKHYPAPGIQAKLPRPYLVVDTIDTVKLSANVSAAVMDGNMSEPVKFTARSSGSHVRFMFEFGDGNQSVVSGEELSQFNLDVTMYAEVTHQYSEVGEFRVKVTAQNPLGNMSADLSKSLWVQYPPTDLHFCTSQGQRATGVFSSKVGENITLCAKEASGTNVTFDWKLGDQTDIVKAGSVIYHQYKTPGIKMAYVTAKNKVKEENLSAKIYVSYEIQGVAIEAEATVLAKHQSIQLTAVARPDYADIASKYSWRVKCPASLSNLGGSRKVFNSYTSTLSYTFTTLGICTVTVKAFNEISNATSETIEISVLDYIRKLEIVIEGNPTEWLTNRSIPFRPYYYGATSINATWSFGDGSSDVLMPNNSIVKHVFKSQREYNITLTATNALGSASVWRILFILDTSYCNTPAVQIINQAGMQIPFSQGVTLEADITADCNLTSTMAYHWSVDGHVIKYANEVDKKVLVLPPRSLNPGKHVIEFNVDMKGTIVYGRDSVLVDVIQSPLASRISGGVYRQVAGNSSVELDGRLSFDPDHPDSKNFSYAWGCFYQQDDGSYGDNCFRNITVNNASCLIPMDTATLTFPDQCLTVASNYTFNLTTYTPGRINGSAFQTIKVDRDGQEILDVIIIQPYSSRDLVNPDRKMSFYVECRNCGRSNFTYKWYLKHEANYNINNYARAHDVPCVEPNGQTYYALTHAMKGTADDDGDDGGDDQASSVNTAGTGTKGVGDIPGQKELDEQGSLDQSKYETSTVLQENIDSNTKTTARTQISYWDIEEDRNRKRRSADNINYSMDSYLDKISILDFISEKKDIFGYNGQSIVGNRSKIYFRNTNDKSSTVDQTIPVRNHRLSALDMNDQNDFRRPYGGSILNSKDSTLASQNLLHPKLKPHETGHSLRRSPTSVQSSKPSVLIHGTKIEEDIRPSRARVRRSDSSDGVTTIEDIYGNMAEDKTASTGGGRLKNLNVAGENKDASGGRGSTRWNTHIVEGQPGEHGSSGGRQYGNRYTNPTEDIGGERTVNLPTEGSSGDGSRFDYLDKLEGNRRDRHRRLTILDKPMMTQYLREEETRTGLHGPALVIRPGVLRQGLTYFVGVKVTDEESGVAGEVLSSFTVNESPVFGRCSIDPEEGAAFATQFRVHCIAWSDMHKPLMYELSYSLDASSDLTLIYRGVNNGFNFYLPAGTEHQQHMVNVYIDIYDALLAKTTVCRIRVKVRPPEREAQTDTLPLHDWFYTKAQSIYNEVVSPESTLQQLLNGGEDALSKVYIGYMATRLNNLAANEELQTPGIENNASYIAENINYTKDSYDANDKEFPKLQTTIGMDDNASYAIEKDENVRANASYTIEEWKSRIEAGQKLMVNARTELFTILERLPIRDEAEVLQTAQTLTLLTRIPEQISLVALDKAAKLLCRVTDTADAVYSHGLLPTGNLVPLVMSVASSIVAVTTAPSKGDAGFDDDEVLRGLYQKITSDCLNVADRIIQAELSFHVATETPVISSSGHFSVYARRHAADAGEKQTLSIDSVHFTLPDDLDNLLQKSSSVLRSNTRVLAKFTPHRGNSSSIKSTSFGSQVSPGPSGKNDERRLTNQNCFQSHMTSFKKNPYSLQDQEEIQTAVSGLSLYDCDGEPIEVSNLPPSALINIDLPNVPQEISEMTLRKWEMNVHQFNVTFTHLQNALHLVLELKPEHQGRLFQLTVLISYFKPPTPSFYQYRYDLDLDQNVLNVFMPPGTFNETGSYYIGLVDSAYNAGRLRPGEVTLRYYTLKLWWGKCLYWHSVKEAWLSDGCTLSQKSTFEVTRCTCDHLTSFGGKFELIPNELSFMDIEGFFSPNKNPVTLTLVCIVVVLYCVCLYFAYHADMYDSRKGGVVYLFDNAPMDQQKYEVTVETGLWKNAGTTSKISIILHGEEGMSETRELISDDDRPMFERNSRDKFILTLPDSIGRIWKTQVWHNNFGPSPSWYLKRVLVRDLNTGAVYVFSCNSWLAVEESDGKVEREFMVNDGTIDFVKAYRTKAVEYLADFHIWVSLFTCPPYAGFMRSERLTVCLTMLLTYMCLNAMWYKNTITEYRGEFGLLDLSWRNVTVGAICCAVVIPLGRFLEFLFRRSKPKHASSSETKDEANEWEPDYPSGKPNDSHESEDSSEHVQAVMTYSLLDQSFLNWPNIQTWAQKQWIKRQQSTRSTHDTNSGSGGGGSEPSGQGNSGILGSDLVGLQRNGLPELDQASSGFEDCSSLIRPKASVDSTHTTAAPSVNESTRVHKPQSLPDSLRISTKPPSELDSVKTCKAPSITSSGSNKSCVLTDRKRPVLCGSLYLPYWCRYIAWILCAAICTACATVTVMYGYRFGVLKSTMWLQSLYFSLMVCVFIANPVLILLAVGYAALVYRRNPVYADHQGYDIFNREKAKQDMRRWKRQLESWDDGEALERGVAARQRSRYLRFARPPQEKQLIEARKRVIKEKRALTFIREAAICGVCVALLLVMAYGKNTMPAYRLNTAVTNMFRQTYNQTEEQVKTRDDWFTWADTSLMEAVHKFPQLPQAMKKPSQDISTMNTYRIGEVIVRQQRIEDTRCKSGLPYVHDSCLDNSIVEPDIGPSSVHGLTYTRGDFGNFMFGKFGAYDGSGIVMALNSTRSSAQAQLRRLQAIGWFDRLTRAIFIELTLYNAPSNLFTSVRLVWEVAQTGTLSPLVQVTSAQLFRYVTLWDELVLACELLFFILMMLAIKSELLTILHERKAYFFNLWNIVNLCMALTSLFYCGCFIYRFAIVADLVEKFRSTYYEKHINMAFMTFWDQVIRSCIGLLLFLSLVKCVRLLRFYPKMARILDVYRKARREVVIFFALFMTTIIAYSSLGHLLFGSVTLTFRDLWSSVLGVSALLSGGYDLAGSRSLTEGQGMNHAINIYSFMALVFGMGMLTSYMVSVLTHYLRSRKRRRMLCMGATETLAFYWDQLLLCTGIKQAEIELEPMVILPPEFTMAEIEYQVDELLFRMNALTGSHGLPEKPTCYLTDSDCTFGGGDDGISSGGSETGGVFVEDRLEQRVQKIEDNLCSQEPFLAQLLKLDGLGADILSQEKEKQLRSHLEMEIFRQLQNQRQDDGSTPASQCDKSETRTRSMKTPHSPGQNSTSSDEMAGAPLHISPPGKHSKPRRTKSSLAVKTIHDLLAKSAADTKEASIPDGTGSNPESPKEKLTFTAKSQNTKSANLGPGTFKSSANKRNNSSSSSEKISDSSNSNEPETIKKPTKPTFLHSRESSLSDAPKGSPILKLRTSVTEKGHKSSEGHFVVPESSSGSEQDGLQGGKKLLGKGSLRKTKSRGKGKGPDSLEPGFVLDEMEMEGEEGMENFDLKLEECGTVESIQGREFDRVESSKGRESNTGAGPSCGQVVTADVHVHHL